MPLRKYQIVKCLIIKSYLIIQALGVEFKRFYNKHYNSTIIYDSH